MGGRWGGDIKGRRRKSNGNRIWMAPRPPKPAPPPAEVLRATVLAGVGTYILVIAGALLKLGLAAP